MLQYAIVVACNRFAGFYSFCQEIKTCQSAKVWKDENCTAAFQTEFSILLLNCTRRCAVHRVYSDVFS